MTVHVVYLKNFEGHMAGERGLVERTRAIRLMEKGTVEAWTEWQKRQKPVEKAVLVEPPPEPKNEEVFENKPPKETKPKKPRGRKKKTEKAVKL